MDDPRAARLTLIACILGSSIVFVDQTVVNVALPALRDDLNATLADQQWVVEAYLLLLGSLVLVGGALGDLYGRRRIFAIGVAGFGAASLVCAAAPSVAVLIAARALQGAFGALLVPSSLAIIAAVFTGAERAAAIGSWTAGTAAAVALGPPLGGLLVDTLSWRVIFALNGPLVLVCLAFIVRAVPECPGSGGGASTSPAWCSACSAWPGRSTRSSSSRRSAGRIRGCGSPSSAGSGPARRSWPMSASRPIRCCRRRSSARATSPSATS
jgi:MFS family permease